MTNWFVIWESHGFTATVQGAAGNYGSEDLRTAPSCVLAVLYFVFKKLFLQVCHAMATS